MSLFLSLRVCVSCKNLQESSKESVCRCVLTWCRLLTWYHTCFPRATFLTFQSLCCSESDLRVMSLKVTFNRKRPPDKSTSWEVNWIFSCSSVSLSSKNIRYLLNRDRKGKWVVQELGWLAKLLRILTHFVIVREAAQRSFDIMHIWHALLNRRHQRCGTKCSHRG